MIREKTSRNSNIELLRIICILAIIAHHFSIHPQWDFDYGSIAFNRVFLQALCIGGKLGVNCFLLISGFFLIDKKNRSAKSILKIWLQMLFYSITIPLLMYIFGQSGLTTKTLLTAVLPITSVTWDYASAYFVLMLFVPFYNRLLQSLNKKEFKKLLAIYFCCWCFIPTITGQNFESNYLIWMFVVYSCGAYIRLYPNNLTESIKSAIVGTIASYSLYLLSVIVLDVLGTRFSLFANNAREIRFGQMQMLPCILLSISVFLLFKNLRIKNSNIINFLANGVFGVYLIHEHFLVRSLLWNQLFKNAEHYYSKNLFLYTLSVVVIVFLCCEIIEQLRIYLLEKHYMRLIHSLCVWIESQAEFRAQ